MRRTVAAFVAATLLTACGGPDTTTPQSKYEVEGDHAVGNPDAPITVVEYASVVCGGCATWYNEVYPDFKKTYIDTGKVRFVFREFPTVPENFAFAGFTIANCADRKRFFDNISLQFKRQRAILTSENPRKAYEDLAKASGLSVAEYEACLQDEAWIDEYSAGITAAREQGVDSTPTFFINGVKERVFLLEDFAEKFRPILGDPAAGTEAGAGEAPENTHDRPVDDPEGTQDLEEIAEDNAIQQESLKE
ncbi:MAG: DsbA family protein [Hyphomonadaceae bacterium]|nr:DsbA family protein [Hyphomonadaceae bacterium]